VGQHWLGPAAPERVAAELEAGRGAAGQGAAGAGATGRRALLLGVGSVYHANGIAPRVAHDRFLLLDLDPALVPERHNSVLVTFGGDGRWPCRWVDGQGAAMGGGGLAAGEVFLDGRLHPRARALLERPAGAGGDDRGPALAGLDSFVPLFLVAGRLVDGPGFRLLWDVDFYSQIRFTGPDALFIRSSPCPYALLDAPGDSAASAAAAAAMAARLGLGPCDGLGWVDECKRLHGAGHVFLNNHQCYYTKCFPGREFEFKLNLAPPVDIWSLNMDFYNMIRAGALPGYMLEYHDEFQAWDYMNQVFEVTSPESERGYISFIVNPNGRYLIKRKWYVEDQLERGEVHEKDVAVTQPLLDFVRGRYGVEARALPAFRRTRYDVNFESQKSGHVYGIFFDINVIVDLEAAPLAQCEVEYLRSRTLVPPDSGLVMPELVAVTAWVRAELDRRGVRYEQGFYSKLSFLKDAVAAAAGAAAATGAG
jgi:hypothetical protein